MSIISNIYLSSVSLKYFNLHFKIIIIIKLHLLYLFIYQCLSLPTFNLFSISSICSMYLVFSKSVLCIFSSVCVYLNSIFCVCVY